jgi:hypothetical protein
MHETLKIHGQTAECLSNEKGAFLPEEKRRSIVRRTINGQGKM